MQVGKQFFGDIDQMINFLNQYPCNENTIHDFVEALNETKMQGYYLSDKSIQCMSCEKKITKNEALVYCGECGL